MAPLIAEYDRHMDQMTEQMEKYEVSETLKFNFIKFEKCPAVVEEEYYFSNVKIRI